MRSEWPLRFDAIDVGNLIAIKNGDIAGLFDYIDKRFERCAALTARV